MIKDERGLGAVGLFALVLMWGGVPPVNGGPEKPAVEDEIPDEISMDDCRRTFVRSGECPAVVCRLRCVTEKEEGETRSGHDQAQQGDGRDVPAFADGDGSPACASMVCEPVPCVELSPAHCPLNRCDVYVDCSGAWVCDERVAGGPPACGRTAYAGQDVACCSGYRRRCGVAFIDNTCDLEGRNSIYRYPICIPCGDGVCQQFENRCNCPEDCGGRTPYQGLDVEAALKELQKYKDKQRLKQKGRP